MMDLETESLWSHILGECVEGELKGTMLETIPSDIVTWNAWRREHPQTTVLNLKRTRPEYTSDFYKNPDRFVLGWIGTQGPQHCSLVSLQQHRALHADAGKTPLLIVYDPDSTSARIYERTVGGRVLTFAVDGDRFRDEQTGSLWDQSGTAVEGPLRNEKLVPFVGILSYATSWQTFHPDSREWKKD